MPAIIIISVALLAVVLMLIFSDQAARRRKEKRDWKKDHFHFKNLCETCEAVINDVATMDYNEMNLNREERMKRERQQVRLRRATREACLGDAGDRDFLKDYIKEMLTKRLGVDEVTINQVIPFSNPDAMTAVEKFEYMYTLFRREYAFKVFGKMVQAFGWLQPKPVADGRPIYTIDEDDIEDAYQRCEFTGNFDDKLNTVVQRVYETLYGNDVADLVLMDESLDGVSGGVGGRTRVEYNYLEELMVTDSTKSLADRHYDVIYCVYHGRTVRLKFLSFRNEETLQSVVKKIYQYEIKKVLSKKNPILHGTMKNNSRVVVAREPVSDGYVFYVRKFDSADAKHIETLITHLGRGIVITLLEAITRGELNFVVSGDMGSGKTTMLKSLVGYMNPLYTIRTAETSFELNLNNLYPNRNIHCMQERGDVSIYDIITGTKKMDTDIMIVGEVNEPKIAGAYVQVAQSGSRMAVTTLHHKTTEKLIEYLRNALVEEFGINDVNIAEKQIVEIINFDVHTEKDLQGNFFIRRITEIVPSEDKPYPTGQDAARLEYYKRSTDRHFYTLHNIIEFDHDNMCYRVVGNISDYTYNLIAEKAGTAVADQIRYNLNIAMRNVTAFDEGFKSAAQSMQDDEQAYEAPGNDEYSNEYANPYANFENDVEPLDENEENLMDFELRNGFATPEDYGLQDPNGNNGN